MLAVQKYLLSGKTLDNLSNDYAIIKTFHKTLPLVILNYDQINSRPVNNEIVRDCRGLTLNINDYSVVARSFRRFFNLHEIQSREDDDNFNWNDFTAQSKVDGSLCVLYSYDNQWRVNTRGSFADSLCGDSGKTWSQLFWETVDIEKVKIFCVLGFSYVFEFCSIWNKNVTHYYPSRSYLLSIFSNVGDAEFPKYADELAKSLEVHRPEVHQLHGLNDILEFVKDYGPKNPSWEGIVVKDSNNNRIKIKNPDYLLLHNLRGNGNIFNPKYLIPLILHGEKNETLVYFGELEEKWNEVENKLNEEYSLLEKLWLETKDIQDQKTFALSINGRSPFTSLLFKTRQAQKTNTDEQGKYPYSHSLRKLWGESADLIYKKLYGDK